MMNIKRSEMNCFAKFKQQHELQEITPALHGINNLRVSSDYCGHLTLDFTHAELVDAVGRELGPAIFVDPSHGTQTPLHASRTWPGTGT